MLYLEAEIGTLGAMAPNTPVAVSVVQGVQRLSPDVSNALLELFGARYPQLTSSWTASSGASQPTFDPAADLWSYIASSTPPTEAGAQTVYEQVQSLATGAVVFVDIESAKAAIAGQPVNVVYAISKDASIAPQIAAPGASLAVISTTPTAGAPAETKKSMVKPLIGAVIGGVGGALVGGGIGAAVGAVGGFIVGNAVA